MCILVQEAQGGQRPQEPVRQRGVEMQHLGDVGCRPGATTEGIEDPELDPGIQDLAAPSAKDEFHDDLTGIVYHGVPFNL